MSSDGKTLPSAREIQVQVFLDKQTNIPDKNNQLLMQWGQFIAQDVSILEIDNNDEGNDNVITITILCYFCVSLCKYSYVKPVGIHGYMRHIKCTNN